MTHAQKTFALAVFGLVVLLAIGGLFLVTGQQGAAPSQPGLQNALMSAVRRAPSAPWRDIYQARAFTPVWLLPGGPSKDAQAVMTLLAQADGEGLPRARYAFGAVPQAGAADRDRAAFEIGLTAAAYAYAHDMALGMLKPEKLFDDVSLPPREGADILSGFEHAVSQSAVADYLKSLEPGGAYPGLKAALARYRALAAHPWSRVRTEDTAGLASRLQAEGYLPDPQQDRGAVIDALKAYQVANGIEPGGKPDAKTLEMLNVPPDQRAAQIAANMERWRWMPRDLGPRYIMVNAPAAALAMVDNGVPIITSRVVVGAPDKPTPILATQAVAVTINPVWHVPKSIVEKEIKAKLDEDPNYLENKDMEQTPEGDVIQHAGPQNALGRVKFEMPNAFDVYLHDTPAKKAFLSDERALSHGCVRVEQIAALVQKLLGIDDDALNQMIAGSETSRKPVTPPLPVYIGYWTAIVREDGSSGFRPDIYGRDAKMIAALQNGAHASRLASNSRP